MLAGQRPSAFGRLLPIATVAFGKALTLNRFMHLTYGRLRTSASRATTLSPPLLEPKKSPPNTLKAPTTHAPVLLLPD